MLKDVCEILELSNSRMVSDRLDDDEKGVSIIDTRGGKQELTVISESKLSLPDTNLIRVSSSASKRSLTMSIRGTKFDLGRQGVRGLSLPDTNLIRVSSSASKRSLAIGIPCPKLVMA